MEAAVQMLRGLPDASHILARSLFALSQFQDAKNAIVQNNAQEAFQLYCKHTKAAPKMMMDMTLQDYDNLLVFHYR